MPPIGWTRSTTAEAQDTLIQSILKHSRQPKIVSNYVHDGLKNKSVLQVSCDHQLTGNTLFCFHQIHSRQFAVATAQWSGTAHKDW